MGPPQAGAGRGVFTLSNGNLFSVVDRNVFYVDANWVHHQLGQIAPARTPVSIADNGTTAVLVDGSINGYTINLATNAFANLVDATGTFVGSTRADYVDTFLTFNAPGTNQWYTSLGGQVAFNILQQGAKSSFPDPIVTQAINLRQAWLLGAQTSEVWYLSGATPFPFEEWPNIFIPYGCVAPYSIARTDESLLWLSRNKDGEAIAVMSEGYAVKAVSTRGLEGHWVDYPRVDDAIGYTYQQSGHTFYVIHFPTADTSWAYDLSTKQWHQRVSIDTNGVPHRENFCFHAFVSRQGGYANTNVVQDWRTGQLYALDQNVYTDNGMAIPFIRSFPHIIANLKQVTHVSFAADISTGETPGTEEITQTGSPWSPGFSPGFGPILTTPVPMIAMRYSNDGGLTWSNYRPKAFISSGRYRSLMRWRGLGMARDRVYELAWSIPGRSVLNGAYLEPIGHSA